MNKDWGKAIAQLCVITQNNTDLKEPVLQYVEFMKTIYGIDGADFLDIYREWERSGEIVDKREKVSCTGLGNMEKNLYPKSMDGLCRLYVLSVKSTNQASAIDEYAAIEVTTTVKAQEEGIKDYEIKNGADGKFIGFYPQYPGCIGFADSREMLDMKMQKSLKNWIRAAYILWKENKILVK